VLKINSLTTFCLLILVSFQSCKNESSNCNIKGKWYFHQVNRNYKPTNTLEGGYFDFQNENTFTSNIFDETKSYNYSFSNDKITITTEEQLNFNLVRCTPDTLILAGEISAFYMNFLMTKTPVEQQLEEDNVDSDLQ